MDRVLGSDPIDESSILSMCSILQIRNDFMNNKLNIMLIGCGRWGSFIATYLDSLKHNVTIYGLSNSLSFQTLLENRQNDYIKIPDTIKLTTDIKEAHANDVIIISVNSQNLRSVCYQLKDINLQNKKIVLCMKGIEISTGKRLSEVVEEIVEQNNKVAVWIGPGHVQSFSAGIPNCMVIDSNDQATKEFIINHFTSNLIRFYYGNDLIGNEIGAATKNVIGIAAGMLDGYGLSSLKGALMARGTREIARLIKALGGNEISAYGLCHLGDYEATLFSEHSHNRQFGENFAKGKTFEHLAEGYYTLEAVIKMNETLNVDLPICKAVYNILYNKENPKEVLEKLFSRTIKKEF